MHSVGSVVQHFRKQDRASNTALEISLEITLSENLGQDKVSCFAKLSSASRLIMLLWCIYYNLGAISSHDEYPFSCPIPITHVLPAQWKRTSESHFFTRQRFPCLLFHRYISGSSFPLFLF